MGHSFAERKATIRMNLGELAPAARREMEIWFAQGLDASSDRRREYAKADELFRQCLARDGGNVLVVRAYLENLARWRGRAAKPTWRGWWERRGFLNASGSAGERYVAAIGAFSREPDLRVIEVLAGACRELGWELAEEAYLRESLLRDAGAIEAHARLAEICVGHGDFECARAHAAVARGARSLAGVEECLAAVREGDPAPASDAAGESGLAVREAREDAPLARIALEIEALGPVEAKGNSLASRARGNLKQKLARMELDLAGVRAERYPGDWALRLTLVEQLIRAGNYFEAVRRLKEPPPAAGALRARGLRLLAETQQRLKRFEEARALYEELLASAEFGRLGAQEQERVRGQYERLAGAMGQSGV